MKNMLLATALAAALTHLPAAHAAPANSSELSEIRQQLQTLMQRVDKLEQENSSLKEENENLKTQTDYLKAETKGLRKDAATSAAEVGKVKGADWAGKVSLKGDMRYRYEFISDETVNGSGVQTAADRHRDRIRARLALEAKATDTMLVGLGIATTEGGDPRSSNVTLDNGFSRKSLDLDLAYFDWRFAQWGSLIGGKMKQPSVKPGQSLFWDGDVNPEGLATTFSSGMFFGSAYYYWLDEVSGNETANTSDTQMYGAQLGARIPLGQSNLLLAAHYYDLGAAEGRYPGTLVNGNTTVTVGTASVLANDFEVVNLSAEFTTLLGTLPLQLWADAAQNQAVDDFDTAWGTGVLLGKASSARSWELGVSYQEIEKDSLFSGVIDSDFGGGFADSKGWVLRGAYAPMKNWTMNATYFLNKRNIYGANSVGDTDVDYDRLQLDFNVKF